MGLFEEDQTCVYPMMMHGMMGWVNPPPPLVGGSVKANPWRAGQRVSVFFIFYFIFVFFALLVFISTGLI
jgi:hypothetical protein